MSRVRVILLGLFAVAAVSAIASASASAALCESTDNGKDQFTTCSGGKEYLGELFNKNTAVASVLEGEVLGFETLLNGATAKASIIAKTDGASTGKIEFTNITVAKPAGCIVKEPVVAEFTDQLSKPPAAITDTYTGSKAGGTFTEIEFKDKSGSTCPLKNKVFKVTGSQVTTFDAGIATAATKHEVTAAFSGSNLKLGENAALFSAKFLEVETAGSKEWSILES